YGLNLWVSAGRAGGISPLASRYPGSIASSYPALSRLQPAQRRVRNQRRRWSEGVAENLATVEDHRTGPAKVRRGEVQLEAAGRGDPCSPAGDDPAAEINPHLSPAQGVQACPPGRQAGVVA